MTTVILIIGLMIAGLALIAIEVFVIPGFGVVGVLGIGCSLASSYLAVTELSGLWSTLAILGGVGGAGAMFWLVPRTRAGQAMVLQTRTEGGAPDPSLQALVGRTGTAITPLRPSGSVEIDDRPVDVVSDGRYVEADANVIVVRVEGSRVVVEPVS